MRKLLADLLFWTLAVLTAVLVVGLGLVVAGVVPIDEPAVEAVSLPAGPAEQSLPRRATAIVQGTARRRRPVSKPKPPAAAVVVTATRGDSWFSARVGSETGRVLDERVLAQGESARFRATRVWLTVGAAGNIDLTVDGKPHPIRPGTVSLVLTRGGSGSES